MKCDNCQHEMLNKDSLRNYWIKWLCPRCNNEQLERLSSTEGEKE